MDISDRALERLTAHARSQELEKRIICVQADLPVWRPPPAFRFALVLCVMYWERVVFDYAAEAVMKNGLVAWQAYTLAHRRYRPSMREDWLLKPGEPASRLPAGFKTLMERDVDDGSRVVRQMIGQRI